MVVCMLLLFLAAPGARTILVHSPSPGQEGNEELKRRILYTESGVLDIFFEKGWILFSDQSGMSGPQEAKEVFLKERARNAGADYILDWQMEEEQLHGFLVDAEGKRESFSKVINKGDFKGSWKTEDELYEGMGGLMALSLLENLD